MITLWRIMFHLSSCGICLLDISRHLASFRDCYWIWSIDCFSRWIWSVSLLSNNHLALIKGYFLLLYQLLDPLVSSISNYPNNILKVFVSHCCSLSMHFLLTLYCAFSSTDKFASYLYYFNFVLRLCEWWFLFLEVFVLLSWVVVFFLEIYEVL